MNSVLGRGITEGPWVQIVEIPRDPVLVGGGCPRSKSVAASQETSPGTHIDSQGYGTSSTQEGPHTAAQVTLDAAVTGLQSLVLGSRAQLRPLLRPHQQELKVAEKGTGCPLPFTTYWLQDSLLSECSLWGVQSSRVSPLCLTLAPAGLQQRLSPPCSPLLLGFGD